MRFLPFDGLLWSSIHYEFTRILDKTLRAQGVCPKAFVFLQNLQAAMLTTSRSHVLLTDSTMVKHLKTRHNSYPISTSKCTFHSIIFFV